jgi:integral membrane protein
MAFPPGWRKDSIVSIRSLNRLRTVGVLEGVSFLVLLGIAMPLKYLAGMPGAVRIVGLIHGLLFIVFGALVIDNARTLGWPLSRVAAAFAAAVLPFGTFVLDRRLRQEIASLLQDEEAESL